MFFLFRLIVLLTIASCNYFSPFYSRTEIKIPKGTPSFQKGFVDGCSTITHARGNMYYRLKYDFAHDPKLIDNSEYNFGYIRGRSWCFHQLPSARSGTFTQYGQTSDKDSFGNFLAKPGDPVDASIRAFSNVDSEVTAGFHGNANEDIFQDYFGKRGEGINGGWFPAVIY
jgi:hypothetical protein